MNANLRRLVACALIGAGCFVLVKAVEWHFIATYESDERPTATLIATAGAALVAIGVFLLPGPSSAAD